MSVPAKMKRRFPLDIELTDNFKSELIELNIPNDSPVIGKAIVELKLPKNALIVLVHRGDKYLTANGETVLESGDHLLVMADSRETIQLVHSAMGIA